MSLQDFLDKSMKIKIQNHLVQFAKLLLIIRIIIINQKLLPVRNKYIAKIEVGNQLNMFVFELGV